MAYDIRCEVCGKKLGESSLPILGGYICGPENEKPDGMHECEIEHIRRKVLRDKAELDRRENP